MRYLMKTKYKKVFAMLFAVTLVITAFSPSAVSAYAGTHGGLDEGGAMNVQSSSTVTLSFNVNGGNGYYPPISRTTGDPIGTLPQPTRTNHTFVGWFTTSSTTGGTQITANSLAPDQDTTYWARWAPHRSVVLSHTGSMLIQGWQGATKTSNDITFNGNSLPTKAKVLNISIHTGSSSVMSGVITGNYLEILSTTQPQGLKFTWSGANNTVFNNTAHFDGKDARATYTVRWNGTVITNTPGNFLNPNGTEALRAYNNVKLTVNYIDYP